MAAGYDNGDVKLFDLRTNSLRWETNVGNGVVGLEFDRKDIEMNKLLVTTLESRFRVYDMRTQHPTDGFAYLNEKVRRGRREGKDAREGIGGVRGPWRGASSSKRAWCILVVRLIPAGTQVDGVARAPPAPES